MNIFPRRLILLVLVGLVIVLAWFIIFWLPNRKQPIDYPGWETYQDKRCGFSLRYPASYQNVLSEHVEGGCWASFSVSENDPWQYAVEVARTQMADTQSWLASQPQSNGDAVGIKFIKWLSAEGVRFAVYNEYAIADQDADRQNKTYNRTVKAGLVDRGYVATISVRDYQPVGDDSAIDQTISEMAQSFIWID